MKITICFKNGTKIGIECDEFELEQNRVTGQIESYKITGIKDTKPVYMDMSEILWITRNCEGRE